MYKWSPAGHTQQCIALSDYQANGLGLGLGSDIAR